MEIKRREMLSVGIDVGTTTSHLVFSRLVLQNDPFSRSGKYEVAERSIVYRGSIHLTPLRPGNREIDVDALVPLLMGEYAKAGVSLSDVETGAVIITGESARKENAEAIVERLSSEGGRFVAATAGPNFEAAISAYGAGAVEYSRSNCCRLVHCDTGGGTSNIAVIDSGRITATACINIGGRLLAFDECMVLTRIEESGELLLKEIGSRKAVGQTISTREVDEMCRIMASTLMDVLTGAPSRRLTEELMTTAPIPQAELEGRLLYSFSGGVAEYIYGCETRSFGDLGMELGSRLRKIAEERGFSLVGLPERIRATVIGASSYTLEVSGPTTFSSSGFKLPIRNVPVTSPVIDRRRLSAGYVRRQVEEALRKIDVDAGAGPVALAFRDPVALGYDNIRVFALGLSRALSASIRSGVPLVLVFDTDVGNSVGSVLSRETGAGNVLALDEISLSEGDFIDVGEPINDGAAYPVVVKSLVF